MARQPIPLEQAFWAKVDKRGPDECWPWIGALSDKGYGRFRGRPASQISWEIESGAPFPEGKGGCHTCDNPPCVNPAHIFPGTQRDNFADMLAKGRGKWGGRPCPHSRPSGVRCLICKREYDAANREKKSEYWRTYGPTIRNERRRQRRATLRSQIQL